MSTSKKRSAQITETFVRNLLPPIPSSMSCSKKMAYDKEVTNSTKTDSKDPTDGAPYNNFDEIDEDEEEYDSEKDTILQLKNEGGPKGSDTDSSCTNEKNKKTNDKPKPPKPLTAHSSSTELDKTKTSERERRLALNRISGQRRRDRKKIEIEALQKSINSLTKDNDQLRLENTELRRQLVELSKTLLRPTVQINPLSRLDAADSAVIQQTPFGIGLDMPHHNPQEHVLVPVSAFPPYGQTEFHNVHRQPAVPQRSIAALPDSLYATPYGQNPFVLQSGIAIPREHFPRGHYLGGNVFQVPLNDHGFLVQVQPPDKYNKNNDAER